LHRVDSVSRFLRGEQAHAITRMLRLVVQRKQIFRDPRHLMEVLMDLALATITVSHYARCRAASEGRREVESLDVREGISVAELALLKHASQRGAGAPLRNTRRTLIAGRENFLHMLASENQPS